MAVAVAIFLDVFCVDEALVLQLLHRNLVKRIFLLEIWCQKGALKYVMLQKRMCGRIALRALDSTVFTEQQNDLTAYN